MKDLKHMIYFEHLLDEAANELCLQAVSEGRHAVGYTCYHMPEVLLNLDNCFSVRLCISLHIVKFKAEDIDRIPFLNAHFLQTGEQTAFAELLIKIIPGLVIVEIDI